MRVPAWASPRVTAPSVFPASSTMGNNSCKLSFINIYVRVRIYIIGLWSAKALYLLAILFSVLMMAPGVALSSIAFGLMMAFSFDRTISMSMSSPMIMASPS